MGASEAVLDDDVLDLSGESAGERGLDSSSPFFVSKKAAAVLKHAILDSYVVPFASKVGRYAPDSRVVYLDGYAGPGRYEDGTPGSPALILDSAARIAGFRQLDCYFVERAPKNYQSLAALVSEASAQGLAAQALKGHVEKHLGQILDRAAGAPLFAFLDPFGLGLSFETLTQQIFGSRSVHGTTGRHATEVLLNFNANAVRRIGGLLTSPKDTPGKPATLRAMDAACGGSWWREEFLASQNNTEAVRRITTGFADRVARAVRGGYWTIDVRNRAHHQVAYCLVHFSRHKEGMWLFGEAASLAQVEWRRACLPPPEEGTLFNAGDTFDDEEEQRARAWVARIRKNLEGLQQQLGTFTIDDHQSEILAGVLGQARNKHIRAAVKQLHKDGKTSCNGVGDVRKLRVTPPPQRRQP
ncbi:MULTISPECIES: three-Cys-motif partner protein TcmP [unclassified Streptomyces]|uniref:three-Cys-motif partner protein TcmP n=1 Tax=unclassified Streptomyces TaxID=2593676 RepID=UPI000B005BEC|nr:MULTISPECIES: three-Cys-motif partner protein TcmP [unclassified Streptomyces]QHC13947.1 three-Cys-motif partner protein TcmP [Streptomyces sp. GF20]